MPWNVPAQGSAGACAPRERVDSINTRPDRRSSACAARRENVKSRMRCGSAPSRTRRATRCASVLVFPEPAPAMIASGGAGRAPVP